MSVLLLINFASHREKASAKDVFMITKDDNARLPWRL